MDKKTSLLFKIVKSLVKFFSPKMKIFGEENYPEDAVIVVGNHSQMYGPISSELYIPRKHLTWCAGQMMETRAVPRYAFTDFWSQKPKWTHVFYKMFSILIAPLASHIFNNANTIAVHRDSRIISTFKATVKALDNGFDVVIFPEKDEKHNNIVYEFQDKFIDVARLYYKKTGKSISFLPVYIAPNLKSINFGRPIQYNVNAESDKERIRISKYLMAEISSTAINLPLHTVVPYRNVPKKYYPKNKEEQHKAD